MKMTQCQVAPAKAATRSVKASEKKNLCAKSMAELWCSWSPLQHKSAPPQEGVDVSHIWWMLRARGMMIAGGCRVSPTLAAVLSFSTYIRSCTHAHRVSFSLARIGENSETLIPSLEPTTLRSQQDKRVKDEKTRFVLTLTFEFFVPHVVDPALEGPLRRLAARPRRLDRVLVQVLAQPAEVAVADEGVPRQMSIYEQGRARVDHRQWCTG